LLKYKVPIKDYPNFSGWAVNWPSLLIHSHLNPEIKMEEFTSQEEAQAAIIAAIHQPGYKSEKKKVIENKSEWINDIFSQSAVDPTNFQKFENTKEFYKYAIQKL
jgi:hypothetical protein